MIKARDAWKTFKKNPTVENFRDWKKKFQKANAKFTDMSGMESSHARKYIHQEPAADVLATELQADFGPKIQEKGSPVSTALQNYQDNLVTA